MILAEKIDQILMSDAPAGYCDSCIAELLGQPNIHAVELRTRALASTPYFELVHGKCARCKNQRTICMPIGPKGQKHTADVIGNAVKAMSISTGEEVEGLDDDD